jgi:hypothetical protein
VLLNSAGQAGIGSGLIKGQFAWHSAGVEIGPSADRASIRGSGGSMTNSDINQRS